MFLAIGMAAKVAQTASMQGLAMMADALNRSGLPPRDEVESSVSRLIAAGLVDAHAEELWLTDAGSTLFEQAMVGTSPTTAMLELQRKWAATGFPPTAPRTWSVPAGSM